MTAGVKYCGGCNPRYDRGAAARQLRETFPQVDFVPAQPGAAYDVLLVLCGCTARCAGLEGLTAGATLLVCDPEDVKKAAQRLKSLADHSVVKE